MPIPYLDCMVLAAQLYALPPRVLPSIQAVEGGQVGMIRRNIDLSADLGVMQVNTLWIRPLAKSLNLPEDTILEALINDACFNVEAAGVIMRIYLNQAHGDLLRAVAYYHSHTRVLGKNYRILVERAATRLFVLPHTDGTTAGTTGGTAGGAAADAAGADVNEAAKQTPGQPPPIQTASAQSPTFQTPAARPPMVGARRVVLGFELRHAGRHGTVQHLPDGHAVSWGAMVRQAILHHLTAPHATIHRVTFHPTQRSWHRLARR